MASWEAWEPWAPWTPAVDDLIEPWLPSASRSPSPLPSPPPSPPPHHEVASAPPAPVLGAGPSMAVPLAVGLVLGILALLAVLSAVAVLTCGYRPNLLRSAWNRARWGRSMPTSLPFPGRWEDPATPHLACVVPPTHPPCLLAPTDVELGVTARGGIRNGSGMEQFQTWPAVTSAVAYQHEVSQCHLHQPP